MDELTGHQQKVDVSIIFKSQNNEFEQLHMKIIEKHQKEVKEEQIDKLSKQAKNHWF